VIDYSQGTPKYERWWAADKRDVYKTVAGLVGVLKSRLSAKRKLDLNHARIYGNYDVAGMGHSAATAYEILRGDDGRMRFQLCTSAVDTALAILTANKPVPYYLTEGATWSDQRKAKKKARIVAGQLLDLDAYSIAQRCARDALVTGTGIMYGFVDEDGKVGMERVPPHEIIVDPAEASAGNVRTMTRERMMATEQLAALYPKHDIEIRESCGPTPNDWADRHLRADGTIDMVMVYEAWHLPTRKGSKDGRHILCTDRVTLVDEQWDNDWFPFADMRWKTRLTGWWGCGLVEETKAAQLRINRLIRHYERCQTLGSNVFVFMPKEAGIEDHEITNQPLQIIPYNSAGGAPTIYKSDATLQDLRADIGAITQETFMQVGISQSQLQGQKPAGVSSGRAIRLAEDIGSRRHVDNVRQYERFFVGIVKMVERLNDIAASKNPSYSVVSLETRGRSEMLNVVEWKEVQTANQSTVRMFPVSSLGSTPAGKMESVQELVSGGYLSKPYALKLLDFPDLDSAMSLELVDLDLVHWQLDRIQDGEVGVMPLPIQNFEMAFEESRKVILQCEMMEADDSVKSEMMRFRKTIERMMKIAAPPPPPQQMAPQSGGQAQAPEMAGLVAPAAA